MKAQKAFKEPAWRLYDVAYSEKAAATGNKKWFQIDTLLYNQLFTLVFGFGYVYIVRNVFVSILSCTLYFVLL